MVRCGLWLLLAGYLVAIPARAWDRQGHYLIAQIAETRLTPATRTALDALARQVVFPGLAYNGITLSAWMDDIRTDRSDVPFHGRFKTWHYIDLPLVPGDPEPTLEVTAPDDEPAGNVVQALKRAVAVLRGGSDPLIADRPTALALVLHLVGDIHQPLHCATYVFPGRMWHGHPDSDLGGNRVSIGDSAETPDHGRMHRMNLHAFWDGAYRGDFRGGEVMLNPLSDAEAATPGALRGLGLDRPVPAAVVSQKADFDAWARESNQLARDDIYGALAFDCTHLHTALTEKQVMAARELARLRLELAGVRLAALLNDLLGAEKK